MKFLERRGGDPDPAIDDDLSYAGRQKILSPGMNRDGKLETPLLDQHRGFPERDRRDPKLTRLVGFVNGRPSFHPKSGICAVEPDQDVGVEQDQRSASQVSSRGDRMSPQIVREPRWRPNRDDDRSG